MQFDSKLFLISYICFGSFTLLLGQEIVYEPKEYTTHRVENNSVNIDGILSEDVWESVQWGKEFLEYDPDQGALASQRTEFKIVYDDDNLYIGYKCYDDNPEDIVSRMSRRDGFEGDWVEINIDSHHDLRTAYSFTSSVSGVKGDEFITLDGNNWDTNWDPIWYLSTLIDADGWVAEIKIPLTQLRYSKEKDQTWGFQVMRRDFRNATRSTWQPISRDRGIWVSGFGKLKGLKNLKSKRQIEIQPYTLLQGDFASKDEDDPFSESTDLTATVGLDGKIGVTPDLTLDFTINPDFGQVEADPSVIVLDGFQVFFNEKRPFFIENNNIFDFRITNAIAGGPYNRDNLFYSRRIGRSLRLSTDLDDDEYADVPINSTILGAAKLSGKTKDGWSIGVLESVTQHEKATIEKLGEEREETVEPLTNYFVGRIQKDINNANTVIGGMLTSTNRDLNSPLVQDVMTDKALTGGFDIFHQWKDRAYFVSANTLFSRISGTKEAILESQTAFERLYQRPDADHVTIDSSATSLSGTGGTLKIGKRNGNFRFEFGGTWRSPGLELNDIGFLRNADEISQFHWMGYRINKPFSIFRRISVNYNIYNRWNFGGDHLYLANNVNMNANFKNNWFASTGITFESRDFTQNALRGGPILRRPNGFGTFLNFGTDERKKVSFSYFHNLGKAYQKSVRNTTIGVNVRYQPINSFNINIGPEYSYFRRNYQYITTETFEGEGDRYIGGRIEQRTLGITTRFNLILEPNLSIQFYGQPFISNGEYGEFKHITNSLASYDDRFTNFFDEQISIEIDDVYYIDENLDGTSDYSFDKPDFSFVQFRSNLVLRWEYIPGSEFFFVWSQNNTSDGDLSRGLLDNLGENIFDNSRQTILVKLTYRFLP